MADDWQDKPLSALCSYINRGAAPTYVEDTGTLVLNQKCIRDQRVSFTEARRTDERQKPIAADRMLHPYDILVNSTGVGTLGRVAQIRQLPEPTTIDSHVTVVRPDPKAIDPQYLGLALRCFESTIEALGEGSTGQTELSRSRLAAFLVPVPPVSEQRSIAHILGALDDKIELNRRMSETLETMARALFKSWFVDFDPVRAKAEGRDTGLPKYIADIFPDDLKNSEFGDIPSGWPTSPVYDIATYINGAAYRDFQPNQKREGLPIVKIAELKAGVTAQTAFSNVEMQEKYRINSRDILFSWSGNPDTSIDTFVWPHGAAWLNQHIFRVVPPNENRRAFVLMTLRYLRPVFAEIARNKQTTGLGHVTAADLKRLLVVLPPEPVLCNWNTRVEPLIERSFGLAQENNTLFTLRDILRPKLISGELRVKDAERRMEAVL